MSDAKTNEQWDYYGAYLKLDNLLSAQEPWSGKESGDDFAHDEMLFIIFHQTYELWFKQILFELSDIQSRFTRPVVDDRDIQPIVTRLNRIAEIFKILERQIDILETMTPQDFIDFRDSLRTASGFQSLQFRLIETRLGLKRDDRLLFNHCPFDRDYTPESQAAIRQTEQQPSLHDQIDAWLARTPFVDFDDYKFWDSYRGAVHRMLDEKEAFIRASIPEGAQQKELEGIARGRAKFDGIFTRETVHWRLSDRALQAALFITVYRTEPMLQGPATMLSLIMDIDALLSRWRYRHALMVQRMMGFSAGTGGSSGYSYLMQTLEQHRIFRDLFALSSYLIPAAARPALPQNLQDQMGYRYGTRAS